MSTPHIRTEFADARISHTGLAPERDMRQLRQEGKARCGSDLDIFSRQSLAHPYEGYRMLRDSGPLAYLNKYEMWIATRYAAVKRILTEHEVFSSAQGIGINPQINQAWEGLLPTLDEPAHRRQRKLYTDVLRPAAISQFRVGIEREAARCVDLMLEKAEFDGILEVADVFPIAVLADLVGFPDDERRQHLVHWATESYHCLGPEGTFEGSFENMGKLYAYVEEIVTQRTIKPNTFASYAIEALDRGEITLRECIGIVGGYATASLDTSANGVAAMFLMLAQHPEQWAMVRAEPELALSAVREILRLETPAAWFCRVTTQEVTFDDLVIPANTRLIHSYAAANRDERAFRDPGRFDVRRDPTQALTWGYGIHVCPGQFISVMELTALLRAMTQRIEHIELTGEPVRRVHNMTRGLESLPMRVTGK